MTKFWMRAIAALEIVGGVFGLGFVVWWFATAPFNAFSILIAPIPVAIYVLSFVAGVALWRGSTFGRKASIIVQAIQLPKIVSPALIFIFSFGFDLWVHYLQGGGQSNVGFEIRFLAFNQFFINVPDAPVGLGVSITACIFLWMLLNHKPGQTSEENLLPPPPPSPFETGDSP